MSFDEYLFNCSESYYDFMDLMLFELNSLKSILNDYEYIRNKCLSFESVTSSISKILENKDKILELNPKLIDELDLLDFLNKKNNLSNIAAKEAFQAIREDKYIKNEYTMPPELENRIKEVSEKIEKIEKIINGETDFKSLNDLLDFYEFDKDNISRIVFGFVLRKNNLLLSREEIQKEKIEEVVQEEDKEETPFVKEDKKEVDETLLEDYNTALKMYREIQGSNKELFDLYYKKYNESYTKKVFDDYSSYELEYIYSNLELSDQDLALVLYRKLISLSYDIEEAIKDIDADNPKAIDYETIIMYINEYESVFVEFSSLAEQINKIENNTIESSSKIYFPHADDGEILISNYDTYLKNIITFMRVSDTGALERRQVVVNRIKGFEYGEEILTKPILIYKKPISVSFVKLIDGGTYILCVDNAEYIIENTKNMVLKNGDVIRKQIDLIENRKIEELTMQEEIRRKVRSDASEFVR